MITMHRSRKRLWKFTAISYSAWHTGIEWSTALHNHFTSRKESSVPFLWLT